MKLLMSCTCLASFIRPICLSDLATDIDNIFNKIWHIYFATLTCMWRVIKNLSLAQPSLLLETSSLVDMDSRSARPRIFALNLQEKEGGGGWVLVCSLYFVCWVTGIECVHSTSTVRPYCVPGQVLPSTAEEKPATAPIVLDLRVSGEVRQVTVVRGARRESS